MQKTLERYDVKTSAMQKQIDLLIVANETQREQNERLTNELTDLTDIHQIEMSAIKTDLKNLEDRLVYKFNDYWSELLEKVDKLDTRVSSTLYSMERHDLAKGGRHTSSISLSLMNSYPYGSGLTFLFWRQMLSKQPNRRSRTNRWLSYLFSTT